MKVFQLVALITLVIFLKSGVAQISEQEIAGTWRPMQFHLLKLPEYPEASNPEMIKTFSKMFIGAVFIFNTDHSCRIEIPNQPELGVKKGYWKWDSVNVLLRVDEWKDRNKKTSSGGLFGFFIKEQDNKILWVVDETPIVLEMEKEKQKVVPQKVKVS